MRDQDKRLAKLEAALGPLPEDGDPWLSRPNAEEEARKIDAIIVKLFGEEAAKYEPAPRLPGETQMDAVVRKWREKAERPAR
jgi:hypothetical protein